MLFWRFRVSLSALRSVTVSVSFASRSAIAGPMIAPDAASKTRLASLYRTGSVGGFDQFAGVCDFDVDAVVVFAAECVAERVEDLQVPCGWFVFGGPVGV